MSAAEQRRTRHRQRVSPSTSGISFCVNKKSRKSVMRSSITSCLVACLLLTQAGHVLADESEVPLFSAKEALKLVYEPISRMVNETTCERIEATGYVDRVMAAGTKNALFRKNKLTVPFMRVVTRDDGVFVARFPAQPNEVIVARWYTTDRNTGRYIYGEPTEAVCISGKVEVGEVLPVKDSVNSNFEGQL